MESEIYYDFGFRTPPETAALHSIIRQKRSGKYDIDAVDFKRGGKIEHMVTDFSLEDVTDPAFWTKGTKQTFIKDLFKRW